jgi:hypothetical protein
MTFQEIDASAKPSKTIAVRSTLHDLTFTDALPGDPPATDGTFAVTAAIAELNPLLIKVQPQPPTADNFCLTVASTRGWDSTVCPRCAFDTSKNYSLTPGAIQPGATLTTAMVKQVSLGDIVTTCP